MSLVLGIIAGLAYGLSIFAGALVALPLLVLLGGLSIFQALPIALFALGICAAIAAGDAVRARQCDVQLAGLLIVGAIPAALLAGGLIAVLSQVLLASLFLIAAMVFGMLLLRANRRAHAVTALAPAALLHAPRRGFGEASDRREYDRGSRLAVLAAGAGCGALLVLCAAPGSWVAQRATRRSLVDQPWLVVGTLTFALAVPAIVGAGVQFLFAPELPGYTAGLYVLGAVAGMGLARRVHALLPVRFGQIVIAVIVMLAGLAMWGSVVSGFVAAA